MCLATETRHSTIFYYRKSMHNIFYTWDEAIQNSYDLAEKVQADGFLPDRVVGIIRGGVITGTIISYFLGKEFQALDANLRDYPHWEHYVPKKGDKKVLFVDDIRQPQDLWDSGSVKGI